MGEQAAVPIHPEAVSGVPQELRWVMPAGTLDFVGEIAAAAPSLQSLIDTGVVGGVRVEPDAVRIRLCDGHTWRDDGSQVRSALGAALAAPQRWVPRERCSGDDVLRAVIADVIDSDVGDFIRSHGGALDVLEVSDGRIRVQLSGACAHCPASDTTLTERFETAVRKRFPALVGITSTTDRGLAGGRRLLGLLPGRAAVGRDRC